MFSFRTLAVTAALLVSLAAPANAQGNNSQAQWQKAQWQAMLNNKSVGLPNPNGMAPKGKPDRGETHVIVDRRAQITEQRIGKQLGQIQAQQSPAVIRQQAETGQYLPSWLWPTIMGICAALMLVAVIAVVACFLPVQARQQTTTQQQPLLGHYQAHGYHPNLPPGQQQALIPAQAGDPRIAALEAGQQQLVAGYYQLNTRVGNCEQGLVYVHNMVVDLGDGLAAHDRQLEAHLLGAGVGGTS